MKLKYIKELQYFLKESSFINEFNNLNKILKIAENQEIIQWQQLLEEVEAPISPQVFGQTINAIVNSASVMADNGKELMSLGQDEIKDLFKTLEQHPELKSALSEDKFIKNAQIMSTLRGFGSKALKLIPLLSFFVALKNFLYGIREFVYLSGYTQDLGIEWYEVFIPQNLSNFIDQNQNDAKKLTVMAKMLKSMKVFIDEVVSMTINNIDGVKDLIFLFVNFSTFGLTTVVDIGISVILAIIDYFIDKAAKEDYNQLLEKLGIIARSQIAKLTSNLPEMDSQNFAQLSPEEIIRELNKIDSLG